MKKDCRKTQGWLDALERTKEYQHNEKRKRIEEYNKNPKTCEQCGNTIEYDKRENTFCGHSCSATHTNLKRTSWNICLNCGKQTKNKKYCCKNCCFIHQKQAYYDEYIKRWKNGKESGYYGSKRQSLSKLLRRYIFEKFESKCCKCGWCEKHPTDGRIPLEINHIDGDALNNKENNLELICPNCHSLTTNYKARNRGNSTRNYR